MVNFKYIKYNLSHRYHVMKIYMKYFGSYPNIPTILMHDNDKLWNVGIKGVSQIDYHSIHRSTQIHHMEGLSEAVKEKRISCMATYDACIEAACDWESARFTKPDKPLNARETWEKYHKHKEYIPDNVKKIMEHVLSVIDQKR